MNEWAVFAQNVLAAGICRGTPMMIAALGELLAERSGVVNLGLEGLMLLGAVCGVGAAHATGSAAAGFLAAMAAGALLALVHAFATVTLKADQVVSGLALVFVGTGLSAVLGAPLVAQGSAVPDVGVASVPLLEDIPLLGPVLFQQNPLTYLAFLLAMAIHLYIGRTRPGLALMAVGENPGAAAAMGIDVARTRYIHVACGGSLAGLAGATLSLAVTPGWVDGMTAGQGWIALGLVIFARWKPMYVALGAVLFGVVRRLPLDLQGTEAFSDPNLGYFLNMLPYLVTVAVLAASCGRGRGGQPAGLGRAE